MPSPFGWDLPPGCRESDLPGCSPQEQELQRIREDREEQVFGVGRYRRVTNDSKTLRTLILYECLGMEAGDNERIDNLVDWLAGLRPSRESPLPDALVSIYDASIEDWVEREMEE